MPLINEELEKPLKTFGGRGDPAPPGGERNDGAAPVVDTPPPTTGPVTPITTEVDFDTETVEGRMNKMNAKDSEYTELNRSEAQRYSNDRGLINSTMAGEAGVEAGIKASREIASQDAATYSDTRFTNQNTENKFLENRQSTDLNKEFAAFDNMLKQDIMNLDADLKIRVETILNDVKFSDETKLQYIATINNIMRDSMQQITSIGLSDRSASAQAAAISLITQTRDAEIAVYEDLLKGYDDWDWGTDFTPDPVATPGGLTGGGDADRTYAPGHSLRYYLDPNNGQVSDSCFTADTLVTMADGTDKKIQDVELGDELLGMDGAKNIVMEYDYVKVGDRPVIGFNKGRAFTTEDHPVMSIRGWVCLDPESARRETPGLSVSAMEVGDLLIAVGDPLITLASIEKYDYDAETPLYNFFLNGNRSYYADGFLVHNKGGD